jgi:SAM-dependent methyltransferase
MTATETMNCPICRGTQFSDLSNCKDFTTTHEVFKLSQCAGCKFVVTTPQPQEEIIGKYYKSDSYISHTDSKRTFFDLLYNATRHLTLKLKKKLVTRHSANHESILDFGCGTGHFLQEMQKAGWKTTGVEPSNNAATKATEKNTGKILRDISELNGLNFDVITLWHVLEHLHNPNEKLSTLFRHLNKNGTIIIAVPNRDCYDAQHYQSNWAAYDVPRHLWHFNQQNMKLLLEKNGFRVTRTIPMYFDSFYVSLLSESYKNPTRNKFLNLLPATLIGLISNLKAIENKNYSSLIYVAKK